MKWIIAASALSLVLAGHALAATGSSSTGGLVGDHPGDPPSLQRLAQGRPGWETRRFEPGSHHYERVHHHHHHHHHHHPATGTNR